MCHNILYFTVDCLWCNAARSKQPRVGNKTNRLSLTKPPSATASYRVGRRESRRSPCGKGTFSPIPWGKPPLPNRFPWICLSHWFRTRGGKGRGMEIQLSLPHSASHPPSPDTRPFLLLPGPFLPPPPPRVYRPAVLHVASHGSGPVLECVSTHISMVIQGHRTSVPLTQSPYIEHPMSTVTITFHIQNSNPKFWTLILSCEWAKSIYLFIYFE